MHERARVGGSGGSAVTEELRRSVGRSLEPVLMEVESGAIRRFAEAVGARAGSSPEGLRAPPGFFGWPVGAGTRFEDVLEAFHSPFTRLVNGGTAAEFFLPVHAGDHLVATRKLVDISEKEGSLGRMIILVIETTYRRENGAVVATVRDTAITY